jgi:ribosomal protein L21E
MAKSKKQKASAKKISSVMHEWKTGTLHSGKGGPVVTSRQQAIAIALSQGRKAAKGKKKK